MTGDKSTIGLLRCWTPDATSTVDLALLFDQGRVVAAETRHGRPLDRCIEEAAYGWFVPEPLSGPVRLIMAVESVPAGALAPQ